VTKKLISAFLFTLALAAAPPDPVTWKITNGPVTPLKTGAKFNVTLTATVTEGWHFYSMKPVEEGPTPTRIWIADGQPFLQAGGIKATTPRIQQDPTFGKEVETYEGEASFEMPVRIPSSIDPGSQMLVLNATYQACNDKICLPPKTIKLTQAIDITR
jgi:DsbC/DsbD-like thiol-disulfide interchange protein